MSTQTTADRILAGDAVRVTLPADNWLPEASTWPNRQNVGTVRRVFKNGLLAVDVDGRVFHFEAAWVATDK